MDLVKERAIPFLAGLVVGVVAGIGIQRTINRCCDKTICEDSKCEGKETEPAGNA